MYFNNNNFTGFDSGYSVSEDNNFGFDGYPLEPTNSEPSAAWTYGTYLDTTAAGLSTAEIENWWLGPRTEGDPSQYVGSTLLGSSDDEFAGAHGLQTGPSSSINGFHAGECYFSL